MKKGGRKKMNQQVGIGKIVAGVAIGAAAGAAAVALSDKKNREKLTKVASDLNKKAHKIAMRVEDDPEVKKAVKKSKPIIAKAKAL